jgi:Ala-tRNA(Pro) deacylase
MTVFERLRAFLDENSAEYQVVSHAPTYTSEESAKARGEDLANGAKAILVKVDERFALFVLSAARRIDSKRVRTELGAKRSRFASPEELLALTGLPPGAVPPFGKPLFDLELYADESIVERERVAFNAGSLTDSIIISAKTYLALARPQVFSFATAE